MKIMCEENTAGTEFIFDGELTIYSVTQARHDLFENYKNRTTPIALNLHNVSEIDTAGVQLLLFAQKIFSENNQPIQLRKSNEHIDHVFADLDVAHYFMPGN